LNEKQGEKVNENFLNYKKHTNNVKENMKKTDKKKRLHTWDKNEIQ
jgi:hypothetical protein